MIPYTANTRQELNKGSVAKRVEECVTKAMEADSSTRKPPMDLIDFLMAQKLLRPSTVRDHQPRLYQYLATGTAKIGKAKSKVFPPVYHEAIDNLRTEKTDWAAVREELKACSEKVKKAMDDIKKTWRPKSQVSPFEQYDRDQKAAKDDDILSPIPDDVIYILVDSENEVLTFPWHVALQWFYGKDFNEIASTSIQTYQKHEPPFMPLATRHVMHAKWLRDHPEFDHDQTPGASCGTYYFGIGGEQGHNFKGLKPKRDSAGHAWERRHKNQGAREILRLREEMLMLGFMPTVTRAHMFVQEILDPKLFNKQQQVMSSYSDDMATKTCFDEPYSLKAMLIDTLTTDHVDADDWVRGFAMMSTFGWFEGGELGLRQLGRKLGYTAGTIIAIKGHETNHFTGIWRGKHRYSVINVCQTLARQVHLKKLQAQGVTITDPDDIGALTTKSKGRKAKYKQGTEKDVDGDDEDEEAEEDEEDEDEGENAAATNESTTDAPAQMAPRKRTYQEMERAAAEADERWIQSFWS